jgi:beta-phosphoglucomutase-like phosphatase (HAD superfamily)
MTRTQVIVFDRDGVLIDSALKCFDEPVRAWLTRRYGIKRSSSIRQVTA